MLMHVYIFINVFRGMKPSCKLILSPKYYNIYFTLDMLDIFALRFFTHLLAIRK